MSNYFLMNKDNIILEFSIEDSTYGENIKEVNSFSNLRPIGFTNINNWILDRNYAKHKKHFKKWLKEWGIDTSKGFVEITHCLGINDCLWTKSVDSELSWNSVNMYKNQFTDVAQKTAFETGLHGLKLSSTYFSSPEFTAEGSVPKFWKKEDDEIFLYKSQLSGAANYGLEANSEFISSFILQQIFESQSVFYDITKVKNRLCSKCKLFTDEQFGYIPFYKCFDYFDIDNDFYDNHFNTKDIIDISKDIGYEDDIRKMFFMDSLIFNQDRHLGNFGFLFNNDTFEIIDFAPSFDYNISMLCNALDSDICTYSSFKEYEYEYMLGHKLGGTFSNIGKEVITNTLNLMIPDVLYIPKSNVDSFNLSEKRIGYIISILENNIKVITGRDIKFKYDYADYLNINLDTVNYNSVKKSNNKY
ncbi:MAG: hypothetical protein E7279_01420 [Lachnospiraceae bacterium]|nr:hypothetical protein [Lachnospiraceae bacterium]